MVEQEGKFLERRLLDGIFDKEDILEATKDWVLVVAYNRFLI